MEILETYPPNYQEISRYFTLEGFKPIFAYGDIIYNPYKIEIYPDIIYHEYIHSLEQKKYTNPDMWWTKYCLDTQFRLEQELIAYSHQYAFLKKHTPAKLYSAALDEMADQLASHMYNLNIPKGTLQGMIKKQAKEITLYETDMV